MSCEFNIERLKLCCEQWKKYLESKQNHVERQSNVVVESNDKLQCSSAENDGTAAAVLMPFVIEDGILKIVYTLRNSRIAVYDGEVSFPGGKVESSDSSIVETALRETEEEIGLPRGSVDVIGCFENVKKIKGKRVSRSDGVEYKRDYNVTCVLGLIKNSFRLIDLRLNKNEVADCFTCPVLELLENVTYYRPTTAICRVTFNEKSYVLLGFTYLMSLLVCKLFGLLPKRNEHRFFEIFNKSGKFLSDEMKIMYRYCMSSSGVNLIANL
eukprot:gene19222-21149_t